MDRTTWILIGVVGLAALVTLFLLQRDEEPVLEPVVETALEPAPPVEEPSPAAPEPPPFSALSAALPYPRRACPHSPTRRGEARRRSGPRP